MSNISYSYRFFPVDEELRGFILRVSALRNDKEFSAGVLFYDFSPTSCESLADVPMTEEERNKLLDFFAKKDKKQVV